MKVLSPGHRWHPHSATHTQAQRRGIVLVIVMVVVTIIALAGFSFVAFMLTEKKGVVLRGEELQARSLVVSGEEFVKSFLEQPRDIREVPVSPSDGTAAFRAVALQNEETSGNAGRFSILHHHLEDDGTNTLQFGPENESKRLNLGALLEWEKTQPGAGRRALMTLPGMTPEIADSLLDWIDTDSSPRENGAEADYYAGYDPPYAPRNGVPDALEELLLVKGVTRQLLFGEGALSDSTGDDDYEPTLQQSSFSESFSSSSSLSGQPPWASLITLWSAERNENSHGEPRINVNDTNLTTLRQSLAESFDEALARFIVLYRQHGPYAGSQLGIDASTAELNTANPARFSIVSLLDLVNARVAVPNANGSEPTIVKSPIPEEREALRQYLPKLLEEATVDSTPVLHGRINLDKASPIVLMTIPGMDAALAEQIVSARRNLAVGDVAGPRHPVWLYTDGLVDLPKMRVLLPYITAGGDVFRAEIVGFFDQTGPTARTEFVIDATTTPARSVYWKDLRSLGSPYSLDQIGLEQAGENMAGNNAAGNGQRRAILTQARAVPNTGRSR